MKGKELDRRFKRRPRHVAAPLVRVAGLLGCYIMSHEKTRDAGQAPVGLAALIPTEHGMILKTSFRRGPLPDLEHVVEVDEGHSETPDPADWEKEIGNVFEDLCGNQPVRWVAMTRPSWLGRATRNRHRHAVEQVS